MKYLRIFIIFLILTLFLLPSPISAYPYGSDSYQKPFVYPINGKVIKGFREIYYDIEKSEFYRHTGIDISCKQGDRISAAGNGEVSYIGISPTGGRTVVIRHNSKIRTTYLNLQNIYVNKGDIIRQGDIIASAGGFDDPSSPECHLHFGVIYNGAYLDPVKLMEIDYSSISRFLIMEYIKKDFILY
jgi:murein DD-endopeptidase MepM/ murein hydrolase activator NlpD